jgi:general secretion pathway protein M
MMARGSLLSRTLAVLLLLGVAAGVWSALVEPMLAEYRNDRQDVQLLRERQVRQDRLIGMRGKLTEAVQNLRKEGADGVSYLGGSTASIAAARLQDRIRDVVSGAGGTLSSVQILDPAADGENRKVGLRLSATVDTSGLNQMLYLIESGRPYLFVDGLSIDAAGLSNRPGAEADPDMALAVRFDVYGFIPGGQGGGK